MCYHLINFHVVLWVYRAAEMMVEVMFRLYYCHNFYLCAEGIVLRKKDCVCSLCAGGVVHHLLLEKGIFSSVSQATNSSF